MDKAILIIDMPSCCKDCPLCVSEELFPSFDEYSCIVENVAVDVYDKPDWCPLKTMPEKYDIDKSKCSDPFYEFEFEYEYNQCIDEILGV